MDGEFEKVKQLLPNVECNTTAAKEHVSKAKRTIRRIKEQVQGLVAMLPFDDIPCQMKIEFIYFVVPWLECIHGKEWYLAGGITKGTPGLLEA